MIIKTILFGPFLATKSIRKGATMEFIQESLGYSSIDTNQLYFAGFEDDCKRKFAYNLMDFWSRNFRKKLHLTSPYFRCLFCRFLIVAQTYIIQTSSFFIEFFEFFAYIRIIQFLSVYKHLRRFAAINVFKRKLTNVDVSNWFEMFLFVLKYCFFMGEKLFWWSFSMVFNVYYICNSTSHQRHLIRQ